MRRIATSMLVLILGAAFAHTRTFPTPIRHVIVVVQENRTPDNLFQDPKLMNNGADIQKAKDAFPYSLGTCSDVGHGNSSWVKELGLQKNRSFCGVNIFTPSSCTAEFLQGSCLADSYVPNTSSYKVIQPYWDIAENYGFANYMFQTNQGPSFPAHQFLLGGTSAPVAAPPTRYFDHFASENMAGHPQSEDAGCIASPGRQAHDIDSTGEEDSDYSYRGKLGYPCYEHGTLTDMLDASKLSWRYYAYTKPSSIWNAPNAIRHICQAQHRKCTGPDWKNVDLNDLDIFHDINTCHLANVSWVIPDGHYSDHPGLNNQGGPDWVADIVHGVGTSKCHYWNDTVVLVTWDDWGGFYDHIPPYERLKDCLTATFGCGYVAGFRVPLLVVSAYTPPGYISGRCVRSTDRQNNREVCVNNMPPYWHDFGSILNFTEYVMGLQQGGISGAAAKRNWFYDDYWAPDYYANGNCNGNQRVCPYGLSDFFDFRASPRSFTDVQALTYHTAQDFTNLVNGHPEDPDMETE